jgi:hypothetical protein
MLEILERAWMTDCKPCNNLVYMCAKLSYEGQPISDVTHYRGLVGALQYLTFTRPDIAYVV